MTRDPRDGGETAVLDYTDATSTFGDRLVLAREASGLAQAQLALRMGVRAQTVRNWEEDRSEPRSSRLQILAGMLNVSMVWLMSGQGAAPRVAGQEPPAGPDAAACLADLRRLRTEHLKMADRLGHLEKRLRAVLD